MTDKEKLELIAKIIADAYEYPESSTSRIGFFEGTLNAIDVVVGFEEYT